MADRGQNLALTVSQAPEAIRCSSVSSETMGESPDEAFGDGGREQRSAIGYDANR